LRIKNLSIIGFKSFSESSNIAISEDLVGIVGPNGCGKSNIIDAIRWVLGAQSPTNLRVSNMEDLIWGGSSITKPTGMAEITLTLEDTNGLYNHIKFLENSEISITRRIYRSNESEYLINKTPVRLKDIHDILMDINLGVNSFSIIELANVNNLIEARPEERKLIIEEICGIAKFKKYKKETLKKIENIQINLARVNDIFKEVINQKRTLYFQKTKLDLFTKIKEKIKNLELFLAKTNLDDLLPQLQKIQSDLQNLIKDDLAENTAFSQKEVVLSKLELEMKTQDEDLFKSEELLLSKKEENQKLYTQLEILKNEIKSIIEKKIDRENNLKTLNIKLDEINLCLTSGSDKILKSEEELKTNEYNIKIEEIKKFELDYENLTEKLKQIQNENLLFLNEETQIKNEISVYEKEFQNLNKEFGELNKEELRLNEHLTINTTSILKLKQKLENEKDSEKKLTEKKENFYNDQKSYRDELEKLLKENDKIKNNHSQVKIKLDDVIELEKKYSGYVDSVKYIIENKETLGARGTILDFIKFEPVYKKAVLATLSTKLNSVIVDDTNKTFEIASMIKSKSLPRCGIIAKDIVNYEKSNLKPSEGFVDYLKNLINYKNEHKEIVACFFSDVACFKNLDYAFSAWKTSARKFNAATLEGDYISEEGFIEVGRFKETSEDIVSRKDKINFLNNEYNQIDIIHDIFQLKKNELENTIKNYITELDKISQEILDNKKNLLGFQNEHDQMIRRKNEILDNIKYLNLRKTQINEEKENISQEIENLKTKLSKNNELIVVNKTCLLKLQEEKKNFDQSRKLKNEELLNYSIKFEKIKLDLDNAKKLYGEAIKNREEILKEKDRIDKELVLLNIEDKQITEQKINESLNKLNQELIELQDKTNSLKEDAKNKKEKSRIITLEIKNHQSKLLKITNKKNKLEIEKREFEIKKDELINKTYENYKIDLNIISVPENFDAKKEENLLKRYQNYKERIKNINENSVKEYDEVFKRYEFLKDQKLDLETSLSALNKIILKTDEETKEVFSEAFLNVSKNFKELFEKLFSDSEATMFLTNPDDILESGIDWDLKIAGKKIKNINTLSSGEKTLTIITYLLSIFYYRSSPFLIMDEIDAPLDDTNIIKFTNLLNDIKQKTQIIIVTHNKQTMSTCNVLYGVTMQKKGESKIVGVKLEKDLTKVR
jgi:chromosome segregation protein